MNNNIRVRFAPSPTGYLHIGGLRTALYNYLFAKKNGGDFILRIEDTDQNRYVAEAETYIINSLKWAGIIPDEGAGFGGDFGPYRQSERKNLYNKHVQTLVDKGKAYYAFDSAAELDEMRETAKANGNAHQQYDAAIRMTMKNSLTFTEAEVADWLASKKPYTVRFKMPTEETIEFEDVVRGKVTFNSSELDDKILMKADGMPTYHLANIVDDYLMQISHVIRGEEWLSSTPLHVMLYNAFNWQHPIFVHLPLIMKPTGKGKLSKRDGEQHGFPVFPLKWLNEEKNVEQPGFKEIGFLPEAFNNMIAFLGWNPGNEQELFSMEELVESFSLERIQKAGARFDWEKAKWFNKEYLMKLPTEEMVSSVKELNTILLNGVDNDAIVKAIDLVKDRMTFYTDFESQANFLFKAPNSYDEKNVKKRYQQKNTVHFKNLTEAFEGLQTWQSADIEATLKTYLEKNELGFGAILPAFRIMLTGFMGGPSVFDIAGFIGKKATIKRINKGLVKFDELKTS